LLEERIEVEGKDAGVVMMFFQLMIWYEVC
jgi:hypothetical protein